MKVTMQQIADIAGVTRATVDKVVHNRPGVRPATREHIQKILTEYNYLAAGAVSSPREIRPRKLAIVSLSPSYDYYFQEVREGMEEQLRLYQTSGLAADYYYYDSADPESLLSTLSYLEKEPIDALAVRGINYPGIHQCIRSLTKKDIPVITFDSDLPETDRLCFIGEDLARTGRIAASLMGKLLNGEGKTALIGTSLNTNSTSGRFEGFLSLLSEEYPKIQVVEKLETLGPFHHLRKSPGNAAETPRSWRHLERRQLQRRYDSGHQRCRKTERSENHRHDLLPFRCSADPAEPNRFHSGACTETNRRTGNPDRL